MGEKDVLSGDQVAELGLEGWRTLQGPLYARYRTKDFATGLRLVQEIAAIAEEMNHHPDVDLRYGAVQVRTISHDVGGKTERDVELARRVGAAAERLGVPPDVDALTLVEHGIDTWDAAEILPFWRAMYGVPAQEGVEEVVDPHGFAPTIWFQDTDRHETPRQRWHPDVWVAPEALQPRIDAAVAAGGTIVDETQRPAFVVLADPQGNRGCLCTHSGC